MYSIFVWNWLLLYGDKPTYMIAWGSRTSHPNMPLLYRLFLGKAIKASGWRGTSAFIFNYLEEPQLGTLLIIIRDYQQYPFDPLYGGGNLYLLNICSFYHADKIAMTLLSPQVQYLIPSSECLISLSPSFYLWDSLACGVSDSLVYSGFPSIWTD